MLGFFREFTKRPLFWRFLALAGSAYLLVGARFVGSFVLRTLLDPIAVGVVNSAQVFAQVFAALTGGTYYTAARKLPVTSAGERGSVAWSHMLANMAEALVLIGPVAVAFFAFGFKSVPVTIAIVVSIAVFALGHRLAGMVESLLMAAGASYLASLIRVGHVIELVVALAISSVAGAAGYLAVFASFSLLIAIVATRSFAFSGVSAMRVIQALKPSRYGLDISIEKLIGTVSNVIDSVVVATVGGPATLAGYYFGVTVRGVLANMVSSFYWAVWPDAVRENEAGKKNVFERWRAGLALAVATLVLTLLGRVLLEVGIRHFLPGYIEFLPSIAIVLASAVPFALVEWDRGRLAVNQMTALLPLASLTSIVIFSISFFLSYQAGLGSIATSELAAECSFLAKASQVVIYRLFLGYYCYNSEYPITTVVNLTSILLALWIQITLTNSLFI